MGADGFIATKDAEATVAKYRNFFDIILCTSFQTDMPISSLYLPLLKPRGNMVSAMWKPLEPTNLTFADHGRPQ